jgi:hypothetical protein
MTPSRRIGLWVVAAPALLYIAWLGAHWLPLPASDKELTASASRVWDIKAELTAGQGLPWWTPNFMSGSSYAINHSRGFYLLPWMALSAGTDLITAGKLAALLALFASALAMYACARYILKNDWAAALAALVFMIHPAQLNRAAGAEHMTIALFFPFIPLLWLTFARMLDTGKLHQIALCALVACLAMFTDNKQAILTFLYLAAYLIYWVATRRPAPVTVGRNLGLLAVLGLALGAFIIVPGFLEAGHVKLFHDDPLREWQKSYSFRSLFGLVDRDGVVTKDLLAGIMRQARTRPVSQTEVEAAQRLFGLQMDAPEKYLGIVFLLGLAGTAAFNYRRENRGLFWFFTGMLLLSIALATGLGGVFSANQKTFAALGRWGGLTGPMLLAGGALVAFLVVFAKRKLTSANRWLIAGGVLAAFLFVPFFDLLAGLPYFKDIRAPYSFYDAPAAFWCAILIGFLITDVVKSRRPVVVGGLAIVLLVDYWPYQRPARESNVPASTIQNLEAAYGALRADKDWVKTYSLSGRYFHLLGPMYSGKPQVYEAFYNWQAPLGLGLLAQAGGVSREFLDLVGARYLVLDKTDPSMAGNQQLFAHLRQQFPIEVENADFIILRNDTARPYVSATSRVCYFSDDLRQSAQPAIVLASRQFTMVHEPIAGATAFPPTGTSAALALTDVELTRENHHTIRIRLTAPQACLVVINESFYPFWTAEVAGASAKVWRVNCGLMGVQVPSGSSEITLQYRPPFAYRGSGLISLLALGVVGVILVRARRRSV